MTTTTLTPSAVSGPLLNAAQVGELIEHLTRTTREGVLEHARGEVEAALDILTMPSMANHSLRSVCGVLKMDPWAPLIDGARATLSGRIDATPVATLTPVAVQQGQGWVLTNGVPTARKHCARLPHGEGLAVTGPDLVVTANTGFPTWMDDTAIAELTGHDLAFLQQTPAQIRAAAGLNVEVASASQLQRLIDGDRPDGSVSLTRRKATELRSMARQIILDSFAEGSEEPSAEERQVLASDGLVGSALAHFRAKNPDPADAPGAVRLLREALAEQVQVMREAERVHAERAQRHRARAARPLARD